MYLSFYLWLKFRGASGPSEGAGGWPFASREKDAAKYMIISMKQARTQRNVRSSCRSTLFLRRRVFLKEMKNTFFFFFFFKFNYSHSVSLWSPICGLLLLYSSMSSTVHCGLLLRQ